jgi:hypothetical protein
LTVSRTITGFGKDRWGFATMFSIGSCRFAFTAAARVTPGAHAPMGGIEIDDRHADVPSGGQRHDRGRAERLGHRRQLERHLGVTGRAIAAVADAETGA